MELVTVDPVMMLTSSLTATSGMLSMFTDTTMSMGHMTPQLSSLSLGVGHTLKNETLTAASHIEHKRMHGDCKGIKKALIL